jgi:hypothetical protein
VSLIGQSARDGFKDTVLKIIEKRIEVVNKDRSLSIIEAVPVLQELRDLKKEISDLYTE